METNGLCLHAAPPEGSKESSSASKAQTRGRQMKRKAVQNRDTPGLGVRDGTPRRIPSEMERVQKLVVRALSPSTKGVSRTAKLAYHQEPVADAQIACTAQLLR